MDGFINNLISQIHSFPILWLILFSFLSACIQQVFPPYPSDILLLIFGGLAVTGVIVGPAAVLPYIIGTILSSLALFYISRRIGKPVLKNKYIRKIFPRREQRKAGLYMKKYGPQALAICKFLPGVNTVCLVVGGAMGLSGAAPAAAIIIAGIVENTAYYAAGMAIGNNLPALYRFAKSFSFVCALGGVAVIVAFLLFKFRKKFFKKIKRRAR